MSIAFDEDGHVRMALGLYFVGGLDDEDTVAVERHLLECARCMDDYDKLGAVASCFEALSETDADDLVGQEGADSAPDDTTRAGSAADGATV
jgi:predicted anti-sigma-YlaC factor YlaD